MQAESCAQCLGGMGIAGQRHIIPEHTAILGVRAVLDDVPRAFSGRASEVRHALFCDDDFVPNVRC